MEPILVSECVTDGLSAMLFNWRGCISASDADIQLPFSCIGFFCFTPGCRRIKTKTTSGTAAL